jgi:hypothetical protein
VLYNVIIEFFGGDEEALTIPLANVPVPAAADIPFATNKLFEWDLLGHGNVS